MRRADLPSCVKSMAESAFNTAHSVCILPQASVRPPSRQPLTGWRVYVRSAPYLLLPNSKCDGSLLHRSGNAVTNASASVSASVSVETCADLCDYANGVQTKYKCCGFGFDGARSGGAPGRCSLRAGCTNCGPSKPFFPRPILPSFSVLARACLLVLERSNVACSPPLVREKHTEFMFNTTHCASILATGRPSQ